MKTDKEIKICPKCRKSFECYQSPGCWCMDYKIPPARLLMLRENYPDCLCPDCLSAYTENPSEIIDK